MSDVMDHLPLMRPVRGEADLKRVLEAAAADNHLALAPNFVVEKDGAVAGYVGLNSVPYWQGWLSTKLMSARDSVLVFNQIENGARCQRWGELMLLLPVQSPFCEMVGRFGYRHLADAGIWFKKL